MAATRFVAGNCHSTQHALRAGRDAKASSTPSVARLHALRTMAAELVWFSAAHEAMDAALAQHLRNVATTPSPTPWRAPKRCRKSWIHGCGGACSSGDDEAAQPHAETATATA